MADVIVEWDGSVGETYTLTLSAPGADDAAVFSGVGTERTNDTGSFFATVTGVATGVYRAATRLADGTPHIRGMLRHQNVAGRVERIGSHVAELSDDAVDAAAIASNAIDADAVADNAINAATIAADAVAKLWATAITESYGAKGAALTGAQLLYLLLACVAEFSISGSVKTCKKVDGATAAATYTLNSATVPTAVTRST